MRPKVSVVIPVYGVEKYIERCARSLFEQTLDNIEYLFIDDCTPDDSVNILRSVLHDYPRRLEQVIIHRMNENSGQAAVRQWGIKHAMGEYIIHCDGDDWIDVNAYKEMYGLAIEDDADIVVSDFFYSDGEINQYALGCHSVDKISFFESIMSQKAPCSLWNKMVKRSLFSKNFLWPKGDMGEDLLICLQLVYYAKRVRHLSQGFYYYYNNPSSITSATRKDAILHRFQESIKNSDGLIDFFKREGIYLQYKEWISSMLLNKKNLLLPLIGEKQYYKLWLDTFPDLNISIFFNKKVSLPIKIRHLLALLHLYRRSS